MQCGFTFVSTDAAVEYQGYDKYCQNIITDTERAQIIESSTKNERLSTQPIALSDNKDNFFLKNKTFLSSIIITILSVLIIFIVVLLVFIYCYVKRCYYDKKQPVKSTIFNNVSNNNTMLTIIAIIITAVVLIVIITIYAFNYATTIQLG